MENINNYLNTILRVAYDNLPFEKEWKCFTVEALCLTKFVQIDAWFIDADDAKISFDPKKSGADRTEDLTFLFMDLRKAMYEQAPGKGAWYTCSITMNNDDTFSTAFDYNLQPAFSYTPSKEKFRHDLDTYPRDKELVPLWLIDIIDA